MRQTAEDAKIRRPKKKSSIVRHAYAIVVWTLTVLNVLLGVWVLTYMQSVEVIGNELWKTDEVVSWVKKDPLTINSIYTYFQLKENAKEVPVYVEKVEVQMKVPWKIEVIVEEKQPVACVKDEQDFVYFDRDGLVLRRKRHYDTNILLIDGVTVNQGELFQVIDVEGEKALACMTSVAKELQKSDLKIDRVIWDEEGMHFYFDGIHIQLGTAKYEEKIAELPPILEKLEGKKGIVHMEHYNKGGIIRFEENTE